MILRKSVYAIDLPLSLCITGGQIVTIIETLQDERGSGTNRWDPTYRTRVPEPLRHIFERVVVAGSILGKRGSPCTLLVACVSSLARGSTQSPRSLDTH